jgi:hypothetical protein
MATTISKPARFKAGMASGRALLPTATVVVTGWNTSMPGIGNDSAGRVCAQTPCGRSNRAATGRDGMASGSWRLVLMLFRGSRRVDQGPAARRQQQTGSLAWSRDLARGVGPSQATADPASSGSIASWTPKRRPSSLA